MLFRSADGPTHHGIYDLSFLRTMPNLGIIAPRDECELKQAILSARTFNRPIVIRYPRGTGIGVDMDCELADIQWGVGEQLAEGNDITIVAAGPMVYEALAVSKKLRDEGIGVDVIDARFVKPLDSDLIRQSVRKTGALITMEENTIVGGLGAAVMEMLAISGELPRQVDLIGIPDEWISMGTQQELHNELGLTAQELERRIRLMLMRPEKEDVVTGQTGQVSESDTRR